MWGAGEGERLPLAEILTQLARRADDSLASFHGLHDPHQTPRRDSSCRHPRIPSTGTARTQRLARDRLRGSCGAALLLPGSLLRHRLDACAARRAKTFQQPKLTAERARPRDRREWRAIRWSNTPSRSATPAAHRSRSSKSSSRRTSRSSACRPSWRPAKTGELRVRVPLLYDKPVALLKQIVLQTNDPDDAVVRARAADPLDRVRCRQTGLCPLDLRAAARSRARSRSASRPLTVRISKCCAPAPAARHHLRHRRRHERGREPAHLDTWI